MKRLLLIFIAILFASCSFDNKTGIWKDASNTPVDNQTSDLILENEPETRYEDIFTKNTTYNLYTIYIIYKLHILHNSHIIRLIHYLII